MPTCLLVCESCHSRQVFFLDETVVQELRHGKTTEKHCLHCRSMTPWNFLLLDRRTGRDRRGGADRRERSA